MTVQTPSANPNGWWQKPHLRLYRVSYPSWRTGLYQPGGKTIGIGIALGRYCLSVGWRRP